MAAAMALSAASAAPAPAPAPSAAAISQHHHHQTSTVASDPLATQQDTLQHDASSVSSSSPPQFPTDLAHPIPEESDEEYESASHNEPVTPVSGRQSSEFPAIRARDHDTTLVPFPSIQPDFPQASVDLRKGPFANADYKFPTEDKPIESLKARPTTTRRSTVRSPGSPPATARTSAEDLAPTQSQDRRRSTRGSAGSSFPFKRTMSNLFSANRKAMQADAVQQQQQQSQQSVMVVTQSHNGVDTPRRWSMARSSANTPRSTTPPSPTSSGNAEQNTNYLTTGEANEPLSKKGRSSTGLSFRDRAVNFALNGRKQPPQHKRASSFDGNKRPDLKNHNRGDPLTRNVFYQPAEAGVGVKARRLSLSLPDDFVIDVADLTNEFEYPHKFLGRHRDGLGKGATAKVRVMSRKGFPGELYAVKEFRGKTSAETKDEYEKKVKSEYSIAKSLHHPNIIETVRLCIDHGRWNHVMEYCSEGDMFSLIKKGHLRGPDHTPDHICLFKQLLQGLNYLHANGIAHRDIKLENLLITKDSKVKITDFGVSEVFSGIHPGARESGGECGRQMGEIRLCNPGICGSEPYIAPEVLAKDRKYDPRGLDVWGAAVVLIALCFGSVLWQKAKYNPNNNQDNYNLLVRAFDKWNAKHPDGQSTFAEDDYPRFPAFDICINPPAMRRVLLMMLNPNPEKRASINEVLNHRWVKNIECCQVESYDDPVLTIDATKGAPKKGAKKVFCHNHLPPKWNNSHSLGKMPGQAGY